MFKKYCDYCKKPLANNDYIVHLRYLKFDGIHNEYYHLRCYDKMRKKAEAVLLNKKQRFKYYNKHKL